MLNLFKRRTERQLTGQGGEDDALQHLRDSDSRPLGGHSLAAFSYPGRKPSANRHPYGQRQHGQDPGQQHGREHGHNKILQIW